MWFMSPCHTLEFLWQSFCPQPTLFFVTQSSSVLRKSVPFNRCSFSTWSLGVTTDPGERQSFVSVFVLNLYNAENHLYVRAFVLFIKTHTYGLHGMVGKESQCSSTSAKSLHYRPLLTAQRRVSEWFFPSMLVVLNVECFYLLFKSRTITVKGTIFHFFWKGLQKTRL